MLLVLTLFFIAPASRAQQVDSSSFSEEILLDEFIVRAIDDGFNVANFITKIKEDTTFYKAFKNMRFKSYNAENDIRCFDREGRIQASLKSETKQVFRDGCRYMNVLEEQITGDLYDKKGNYNYFTAQMYASLFFTKKKTCIGDKEEKSSGRIEKSKEQLKQLMFNPGSNISGLPFMSNKVGIFEPDVARMYDFSLSVEQKNGEETYRFSAIPKAAFRKKVVINKFVTWFRPADLSIIARDYSLSYNAMGYDFDVDMYVVLQQIGKDLLPAFISYRGNWKVVTKSRERVNFKASFTY